MYFLWLTRSGSDSDFLCRFIPGGPTGGFGGIRLGGAGICLSLVCTLFTGSLELTLRDLFVMQNLYKYKGSIIRKTVTTNITIMTIENISD